MYNLPEFQRQVVEQQNPYRAISNYGNLRAQAMATQLGRQLQYQQIAQANRNNIMQHRMAMMGLKNRMGQLKLQRRQLRQDQSMFPWEIGLGLATTGLNAWQQHSQNKERKAQIARHEKEFKETQDYIRNAYKIASIHRRRR